MPRPNCDKCLSFNLRLPTLIKIESRVLFFLILGQFKVLDLIGGHEVAVRGRQLVAPWLFAFSLPWGPGVGAGPPLG